MAGLDPEQIAQIRSYEIAGERTRQQPISTMIEAQLGLSREDLDAARVKLLQTQEARLGRLAPLEERQKIAQTRASEIASLLNEKQLQNFDKLSKLDQEKLVAEIGGVASRTRASSASAALDEERLAQAKLLGPEALKQAQEDIAYRKAMTGEVGKSRQDEQSRFERTHVEFTYPDGTTKLVPASDAMKELAKGGVISDKDFQQGHTLRQESRQDTQDEIKLQDEARKAEKIILGTTKGTPNINNEAVIAAIDEHNAKSNNRYFYKRTPGNWYGATAEKIPLITKEGKTLRAKDVYSNWQRYQAQGGNLDLEGFAKRFVRGEK